MTPRTFRNVAAVLGVVLALSLVYLTVGCDTKYVDVIEEVEVERDEPSADDDSDVPGEPDDEASDDEDEDMDGAAVTSSADDFLVGGQIPVSSLPIPVRDRGPSFPLSVCNDCAAATKGGCGKNGGDGKKVSDGTTRTEMADGSVWCVKDCADGSVHSVRCQ